MPFIRAVLILLRWVIWYHRKSSPVLDELIIGVLVNNAKTPLFTIEERVEMLRECTKQYPNVSVATFDGMTGGFCPQRGCHRNDPGASGRHGF